MKVLVLLVACLSLAFAASYEELWTESIKGNIIKSGQGFSMYERSKFFYDAISKYVDGWFTSHSIEKAPAPTLDSDDPYPYFGFIPYFMGSAIPDGSPLTWQSRCFKSASLKVTSGPGANYTLAFSFSGHQLGCSDFYWIGDLEGSVLPTFSAEGAQTINWQVSPTASSSDLYDITHTGFRVLMFADNEAGILQDLAETVAMFQCFFTPSVSADCATRNAYFIENYSGFPMNNRTSGQVNIDTAQVRDGDFFGILRLDGVDPMLAWAMGSTTGHTATALHINGTLYVCESTTIDAYWPVNGVQCTEFQQWIKQTTAANMNIDWCPLSDEYSSVYNADKALSFFNSVQGLDYGWYNLLYGWIDTIQDNYPCVPPYPSTQCLTWGTVEVLFAGLERIDYDFVQEIFNQAMNLRLGTSGLNVSEIFQEADVQGIPRDQLPVIVESDTFLYNTTRYGTPTQGMSMVCCVFVCEMWKNAGIFDEVDQEINCAEFTNWDDYTLDIFSTKPRPDVCTAADPDNTVCQIMGDYELILNNYNSKAEYAHMAEQCPSEAPDYTKPDNC